MTIVKVLKERIKEKGGNVEGINTISKALAELNRLEGASESNEAEDAEQANG